MAPIAGFAGVMLMVAGIAKLWRKGTEEFLVSVGVAPILARIAVPLAALTETAVGAALLLGVLPFASASAAGVLAVTFLCLQAAALRRVSVKRCACFGSITGIESKRAELVRTGVFAAAVGVLIPLNAANEQANLTIHAPIGATIAGGAVAAAFILGSSLIEAVRWARMTTSARPTAPGEVELA